MISKSQLLLLAFIIILGIAGSFYFYYTKQYILILGTIGVTLVIVAGIISWIGNTYGRRSNRSRNQ